MKWKSTISIIAVRLIVVNFLLRLEDIFQVSIHFEIEFRAKKAGSTESQK